MTTNANPNENPPRVIKTVTLGAAITQFLVIAAVAFGFWWVEAALMNQDEQNQQLAQETETIHKRIELVDAAHREEVDAFKDSVETLSERLESITRETESTRQQRGVVQQHFSDTQALIGVSRANVIEAIEVIEGISEELNEFADTEVEWSDLINLIKKRDAASAELLSSEELELLHVWFVARPVGNVDSWRLRLRELATPVQNALREDTANFVPEPTVAALNKLADEVRKQLGQLRLQLNSLKAISRKFDPPAPPAVTTLADAVIHHQHSLAEKRNQSLLAEVRPEFDASTRVIRAAVDDTINLLEVTAVTGEELLGAAQAEADKLEKEILAQQARERTETRRREEGERQQAVELLAKKKQHQQAYEVELPEIKRLLIPFLSNGTKQLNGTKWRESEKPAPLSYSGIRATGSLANDAAGYRAFMWLAGGPHNDRPSGTYPSYIGGDVSNSNYLSSICRGQSLLSEYGELLVADGLLAP